MLSLSVTCFALLRFIGVPFDYGANIRGAAKAPRLLRNHIRHLPIIIPSDGMIEIDGTFETLRYLFFATYRCFQQGQTPLVVGGDHSIAIASVAASQTFAVEQKKSLGVLWCDAHADFNTLETSVTKNIHGMPVAVLCGHTIPSLQFSVSLHPDQFLFWGVRDLDPDEADRFDSYEMQTMTSIDTLKHWMKKHDYIHVSFDVDCMDPLFCPGVSTPVSAGLRTKDVEDVFVALRASKKVIAMDLVEYNPNFDIMNATRDFCISVVQQMACNK